MKSLTYVEIDVDYCALTYSVLPCLASLGVTGDIKCFNTTATCQSPAQFSNDPVTLRFAFDSGFLPLEPYAIPCVEDVSLTPATLSLGGDMGQRASAKITFRDIKHSDTGPGFDKYYAERSYDPFNQGSLWGKFRARQPYLKGRPLRVIRGEVGQAYADMDVYHYIIESFDGPSETGMFSITAQDIAKYADADRAQAPVMNTGYLVTGVADLGVGATFELQPSGVGDLEYPESGTVAIGGKEIISFTRDIPAGNDTNTLLLLHMEGTVAGGASNTDWIDSSSYNRAATRAGTPTFQSVAKFGLTGMFSPSDDGVTFADSADWDLTSNKTIDSWHYITTLAAGDRLWSHANSATVGYRLLVNADGSVDFTLNNTATLVNLTAPAGTITANTWFHYAVERYGNLWTLYINGAVVSQQTTDPNASYPAVTGTFKVALGSGSTNGFIGYTDEFRVSNVARYNGAAFAVNTIPYQTSSDILYATARGLKGTTAQAASAQDRVQNVLSYSGEDVADIIYDLLVNYAGVPASYIDLPAWQAETALFLNTLYTGDIAEPTSVRKLVSELIEQAALALWTDNKEQQIKLQVLRSIQTDAALYGRDNIIENSFNVQDQPEKRVSQVWVYYSQINPLEGQEEANNYRSTLVNVDFDSQVNYGSPSIKKIFSRWIPTGGRTVAERLSDILISRFKDPPRRITYEAHRGVDNANLAMGLGIQVSGWHVQDATGAPSIIPAQITRFDPDEDKYKVEAEELRFDASTVADKTVIIETNSNNVNFRTMYDNLYPEPVSGDNVYLIVVAGVIVGSSSTSTYAIDTGTWPAGVILNIEINGRVQGKGGEGGRGAKVKANSSGAVTEVVLAEAGEAGGTALKIRQATNLSGEGEIWGGGGGGGGGGAWAELSSTHYGGAAGGGAGTEGGAGALKWKTNQTDGDPGTTSAGGFGKNGDSGGYGGKGGNGGGPAIAGSAGQTIGGGVFDERDGGLGGAAGKSIDGDSFVTETGTLDVRGARIG